jgi:phospholipid transport system substrate-binding protein
MKTVKNIVFLLLFSTALLSANTQETVLSDVFLHKMDKILDVVKNKKIDKEHRNNQIVQIISPMFDFELMAKLTLGSKEWKKLSKEKQQEFTRLYVKRMEKSYSSKVDSYTNEKIVIRKIQKDKKGRVRLISDIVGNGDDIEMIYKYYKPKSKDKDKDEWLVYDVEILGVSIIKTDKSQFKEILKSNSIDDLMSKMITPQS